MLGCRLRLNKVIADILSTVDKRSQCMIRDEMKKDLGLGWEEFAQWIQTASTDDVGAQATKAFGVIFGSNKAERMKTDFICIPRDSGKLA